MLGAVAYMTADEKRALREYVERMSADAEIDRYAVYEAMVKGHIFINDLIHIQQMKNGMLRNIGFEPFAFEAADYIRIGQKETEEDRRRELSVVVTEKLKNMPSDELDRIVVDTNKFSSVLGNVVQLRGSEKEPVMDIVKEADEKNNVGGIAVDRLRSLIERIERLEEEKKALSGDIRDIFAEAKSAGFDVKIMREILKLRKMNAADRDEQEYLLDTYRKALDL
nr:MAG TPA: UPF0335 protein [Caudoviricetes sp.]